MGCKIVLPVGWYEFLPESEQMNVRTNTALVNWCLNPFISIQNPEHTSHEAIAPSSLPPSPSPLPFHWRYIKLSIKRTSSCAPGRDVCPEQSSLAEKQCETTASSTLGRCLPYTCSGVSLERVDCGILLDGKLHSITGDPCRYSAFTHNCLALTVIAEKSTMDRSSTHSWPGFKARQFDLLVIV